MTTARRRQVGTQVCATSWPSLLLVAPVAKLIAPSPRSCSLQTAGSRRESCSLPASLEGRAQNRTRRAALRDQEVSIVLDHTDITGVLATAAYLADPRSERRRHLGSGCLHQDRALRVSRGLKKLRSKHSNVNRPSPAYQTPVTKTPTQRPVEPTLHAPGHPPSGQPSPLPLQQSLSRWFRVTPVEINGVRLSTHFFSTVEKYFP